MGVLILPVEMPTTAASGIQKCEWCDRYSPEDHWCYWCHARFCRTHLRSGMAGGKMRRLCPECAEKKGDRNAE